MMEDPGHQQMATNLATQLLQELDAKIQSTPNDPDKFLMSPYSHPTMLTRGDHLTSGHRLTMSQTEP